METKIVQLYLNRNYISREHVYYLKLSKIKAL